MRHYAAVGVNRILHPDVAVGYRFIHQGKAVAISGDTGMCSGLIELVRGADVAYIDSTLKEEEVTDTILNNLHLSQKKAEEIGRFAKKYIPIHLQGDEEN
jgi:ribonuclease BN (tRNA processing enzyme)